MQVTVKRRSEMTRAEMDEYRALGDAVYPDGLGGPPELERVEWDDPVWDIIVRDDDEQFVSHAGILERNVLLDGQPLRIAGIAEVLTHPDHRRQGYGAAALREAERIMRDELRAPFALLVCPETAIPFYTALGWQRFNGTVLAEVEGVTVPFTVSITLLLPLTQAAPDTGVIDLQGIPW